MHYKSEDEQMGEQLREFLRKIDKGELVQLRGEEIDKREELRRVRLQCEAVIEYILDSSPEAERELRAKSTRACSLAELTPEIEALEAAAEERRPGITAMVDWLVKKEMRLAAEVEG